MYEVVEANRDVRNRKLIHGEYVLKVVGFHFGSDIGDILMKPFNDRIGSTIVVKLPWKLMTLKNCSHED
jgi:hypothetical protein